MVSARWPPGHGVSTARSTISPNCASSLRVGRPSLPRPFATPRCCSPDSAQWGFEADSEEVASACSRWRCGTCRGACSISLAIGMGEKPLYYGWQRRRLHVRSELKALRAHPGVAGRDRSRRGHAVDALRATSRPVLDLSGHPQASARHLLILDRQSARVPATADPSRILVGARMRPSRQIAQSVSGSDAEAIAALDAVAARIDQAADGRRRAARRVPLGRHRFLDRRRADAGAEHAAGQDASRSAFTRRGYNEAQHAKAVAAASRHRSHRALRHRATRR